MSDKLKPKWYRGQHPDGREFEAWDIGEAFELNHRRATAVEYILRAGKKDGEPAAEAISKAITWLQRDLDVIAAVEATS